MLLQLLGLMGSSHGAAVAPTVSTLTVAQLDNGLCNVNHTLNRAAAVRGTFAIANPDWTNFSVKVYVNNIIKATLTAAGTTHVDVTISGLVRNDASGSPIASNYRVDVIRNIGGAVVSTKTTNFAADYADCSRSV